MKRRPYRAEDWWVGKASLLVGLVYLLSVYYSISFCTFWWYGLLSITTIIGFASFGYLVNDYFDQEKDALAGKKNFLLGKSAFQKGGYTLISLFILFFPWYFLPYDQISIVLICIQLLCYFIYSVPAIRLKEKGMLGLVTDALYAHGVPAILAAYTYMLIAVKKPEIIFLGLLFCWQFCVGIRNVLLHQKNDLESDRRSGTSTFFSTSASAISTVYLQSIELFFLVVLLSYLSLQNSLFIIALLATIVGAIVNSLLDKESGFRFYFPNILYDQWLPYSYIIILTVIDIRFLFLLPVQAILFTAVFVVDMYRRVPLQRYGGNIGRASLFSFIKFKVLVNWLIYIGFRLMGINLIKEKTDAKGYFMKRINRQK